MGDKKSDENVPGILEGDEGLEGFEGEPQLFEKVKPAELFDFERFTNEIDTILTGKVEDEGKLLNELGVCLFNAVRSAPQIAQEIRSEFMEHVTGSLYSSRNSVPRARYHGETRYEYCILAHRAVGTAFDMLAGGITPPSEVDKVIGNCRRWVGEGRRRGTGG